MARLRNRISKADYWQDGYLLRLHRDIRETYRGLWQIAEDSGCLENDPFVWKMMLWRSPLDDDITVEVLSQWRDVLVRDKKLVPYQVGNQELLFILSFHDHEAPRNPQAPDLPLPEWVKWVSEQDSLRRSRGHYEYHPELLPSRYCDSTAVPALPCPALSRPALSSPERDTTTERSEVTRENTDAEIVTLIEKANEIEGWKRNDENDVKLFKTMRKSYPIKQIAKTIRELTIHQAATHQYKDPRRALANWVKRQNPEPVPPSHVAFEERDEAPGVPMPPEVKRQFEQMLGRSANAFKEDGNATQT